MVDHRVKRDGEGIGEHRVFVRHVVGHGISIEVWAGIRSAHPPVASDDSPVCSPVASGPVWKCSHKLYWPCWQDGQGGSIPRGRAGQPRVQHDALADLETGSLGTERLHRRHHLVAHHLREAAQPGHRVVDALVAEVQQGHLRVGAADAREPRAQDGPVGAQERRVGHLAQTHRASSRGSRRAGCPRGRAAGSTGRRPRPRAVLSSSRASFSLRPRMLAAMAR